MNVASLGYPVTHFVLRARGAKRELVRATPVMMTLLPLARFVMSSQFVTGFA
jgi:hypothetical protein